MPSVAKALADSATRYAQRAVSNFVRSEHADFYLAAGIALEQAMKARLARENPIFLAPDRSFKSSVALWRAGNDVNKLPVGTRTVGGGEAFSRVIELEPPFARHKPTVEDVLRYRNGESHIGAPGSSDHRTAFRGFVAAMNELLRVPPDEFWGNHAHLIRVTVDKRAADVERLVTEKLARARIEFAARYDGLDGAQRTLLLTQRERDLNRGASDEELLWDCPACSSPCLLSGDNRVEFEYDPHEGGSDPFVEFNAQYLECSACDLELDGADELEIAGIEVTFLNEQANLDEYMRDYYDEGI